MSKSQPGLSKASEASDGGLSRFTFWQDEMLRYSLIFVFLRSTALLVGPASGADEEALQQSIG